jgi:hypothetical protein
MLNEEAPTEETHADERRKKQFLCFVERASLPVYLGFGVL